MFEIGNNVQETIFGEIINGCGSSSGSCCCHDDVGVVVCLLFLCG